MSSANRCDPTPTMENAYSEGNLALKGSVIVYRCDSGYNVFPLEVHQISIVCDGFKVNANVSIYFYKV